jgi:hypothetical protein
VCALVTGVGRRPLPAITFPSNNELVAVRFIYRWDLSSDSSSLQIAFLNDVEVP